MHTPDTPQARDIFSLENHIAALAGIQVMLQQCETLTATDTDQIAMLLGVVVDELRADHAALMAEGHCFAVQDSR